MNSPRVTQSHPGTIKIFVIMRKLDYISGKRIHRKPFNIMKPS